MRCFGRGRSAGSPRKESRIGRGTTSGRRAFALFLTGVLTFESAFGTGLSTALAEPLAEGASEQNLVQLVEDDDLQVMDATERTEPWDWTGDTAHLKLESSGFAIDYESAKDLPEEAEKDDESAQDAEEPADSSVDLAELLPEELPATLDLTFSLDPAAQDVTARDDDVEQSDAETPAPPVDLIPGDSFTVTVPEGMMLRATDAIDLFQLDVAGEPTSVRVATAEAQDEGSSLKVTLVEPEDIADQTDQIGDQTESTTTDEQQLTTVSSRIELPVSLKTNLLSKDEGELAWTLQADGTDQNNKQEAVLTLPSLSTVIDELGLNTTTDKNDDADGAEEGTEDTPQVNGTYTPHGDPTQKTFTVTWADNNDSGQTRPTTDDVKSGLVVTFTIDNEEIALNEETAQKYFGVAKEDFAGMVSVTQAGVGTYSVELSNLYSAVLDENGDTKQVTWGYSFSDNDYFGSRDADGNLCFQLLGTSTYTIVAKVGEERLSTDSAPATDFVVIDGSGNEVKLADVNKQPGWEGSWDEKSGTYTLKAPAYGKDGLPIDYGLKYDPETPNPTPDDTYTVTYDNAASTNHGSSTTAVYDGGTATILRVGTTTFTATKQWLDVRDKQGKRPKGDATITFTLWRCSSKLLDLVGGQEYQIVET